MPSLLEAGPIKYLYRPFDIFLYYFVFNRTFFTQLFAIYFESKDFKFGILFIWVLTPYLNQLTNNVLSARLKTLIDEFLAN
tara:strand:+ start:1896 stop:2138 length:243 start_codon:yes stop_codon:yes gene_type:complete